MRTRTSAAVAAALLGGLALSACGSNQSAAPGPVTTTASSSAQTTTGTASTTASGATSAGTASTPATALSSGCAPAGTGVPAGAVTKQVIDVDGDGRPDTGWISGGTNFGITTASGATFSVPINLAGGGPRSVLVENTDGRGTIAALASDGRTVDLLLVRNCGLSEAKNIQGETYQFDLGYRGTGTGVGCSQVAGTPGQSLVGLNVILNAAGQPESVRRTQIIIEGTSARNGAADTIQVAGNPAAAASGAQISCGDLTMSKDGVVERS
ncbi:MAG: hypothetical protein ACXVGR_06930 [Mycobacteriaceae bacterium]